MLSSRRSSTFFLLLLLLFPLHGCMAQGGDAPSGVVEGPQAQGRDKIFAGTVVEDIGDFPFMAMLVSRAPNDTQQAPGEEGWKHYPGCGATLIDPNWALTAAHCISDSRQQAIVIGMTSPFAGEGTPSGMGEAAIDAKGRGEIIEVLERFAHPGWLTYYRETGSSDRGTGHYTYHGDIALLRLKSEAIVERGVQRVPVRLASPLSLGGDGLQSGTVTTLGWGKSAPGWNPSRQLRRVSVPVLDNASCRRNYDRALGWDDPLVHVLPSMLCSGDLPRPDGGSPGSACQGDSGGPTLYRESPDAPWQLVGVVSFNWGGCRAAQGKVSVDTRVSYFADWIHDVMAGRSVDDGGRFPRLQVETRLESASARRRGGAAVVMDASRSWDPERGELGYHWIQTRGPAVRDQRARPEVFAFSPVRLPHAGTQHYGFAVHVTDGVHFSTPVQAVCVQASSRPRSATTVSLVDCDGLPY